jgi:hypothetical protein
MECIANFEIKSELSVFADNHWLKFRHPSGLFRARLRNIKRDDFTPPFLLTLHLAFDAPSIDESKELAEERLADCLNMLSFVTASRFSRHRIRQIVDGTLGLQMRSCLMWADSADHEDPTPFLDDRIVASMERLLSCELTPSMQRAMRWYRLGIGSTVPDDQFQCFWFALELLAVSMKSKEKEPDLCPHCRHALYCENCKKHPVHRPYDKQAIGALIRKVDKNADDLTLAMLNKTRNSLMHGATLREIEKDLPEPREQVVDVLARIVFNALVQQFPLEAFKKEIAFGNPSTYVHRTLSGIAHIQTVVPIDADGELDLDFPGMKVTFMADGPPQSARPCLIGMSIEHYEQLSSLRFVSGDHQEMCTRIYQNAQSDGQFVQTVVLSTDWDRIRNAVNAGDMGNWQNLFREIISAAEASGGGKVH